MKSDIQEQWELEERERFESEFFPIFPREISEDLWKKGLRALADIINLPEEETSFLLPYVREDTRKYLTEEEWEDYYKEFVLKTKDERKEEEEKEKEDLSLVVYHLY
eukprot:TRINITY_DN15127_c0_g1_i2.p1 TRINITY_DN15127_c0_g1~~TRINITY_DN15127_c0_g1_i2.p1  ORF type:complete len:107 (-),score=19.31 TRINITY_DN15127_c0_g1_i2:161-481(-)